MEALTQNNNVKGVTFSMEVPFLEDEIDDDDGEETRRGVLAGSSHDPRLAKVNNGTFIMSEGCCSGSKNLLNY